LVVEDEDEVPPITLLSLGLGGVTETLRLSEGSVFVFFKGGLFITFRFDDSSLFFAIFYSLHFRKRETIPFLCMYCWVVKPMKCTLLVLERERDLVCVVGLVRTCLSLTSFLGLCLSLSLRQIFYSLLWGHFHL